MSEWFNATDEYLRKRTRFIPIETRVRCKDGTYRYIEFGFEAVNDIYITTFTDLTERKIAEQQLIESEKKLKEQNEEYLVIMQGLLKLIRSWKQPMKKQKKVKSVSGNCQT